MSQLKSKPVGDRSSPSAKEPPPTKDHTKRPISRRRRLLRWALGALGSVVLLVLGAAFGGFFALNSGWIPKWDPFHHASSPLYEGQIVRVQSVGAFRVARASPTPAYSFAFGDRVRATGYCIGQPRRDPVSHVFDERWLILKSQLLVPAAYVSITLPAHLEPIPCPAAEEQIGGPQAIVLGGHDRNGKLRLWAHSAGAVNVGFAVFGSDEKHWRPISLRRGVAGQFTTRARLPARDAAVVMATACWGPGSPARPDNQRPTVQRLKVLQESAGLAREAAEEAAAGSRLICDLAAYGGVKINVHSPSPEPAVPASPEPSTSTGESRAAPVEDGSGGAELGTGSTTTEVEGGADNSQPSQGSSNSIVLGKGKSVGIAHTH